MSRDPAGNPMVAPTTEYQRRAVYLLRNFRDAASALEGGWCFGQTDIGYPKGWPDFSEVADVIEEWCDVVEGNAAEKWWYVVARSAAGGYVDATEGQRLTEAEAWAACPRLLNDGRWQHTDTPIDYCEVVEHTLKLGESVSVARVTAIIRRPDGGGAL